MSRRAGSVARSVAAALALALVCASGVARAQFTANGLTERNSHPELNERKLRSGLIIGLMLGYSIAKTSGYPNDANQIGNPNYYSSSDVMLGSGGGLFIGGALADYLNFGFFFVGRSYKSNDWKSSLSGFGFRVEAFPLVYAVPKLKNLGLFTEFGIGAATLDTVASGYPEAKGVSSFIGLGGFYEWKIFKLFGGHAVAGPMLEYDTVFSTSITSGAMVLGARVVFYGGM